MGFIVTEFPDVDAVHGEAPLGVRESARPTSNGVNLRDRNDDRIPYTRSDRSRIEFVSIGGDPLSRPCNGRAERNYVLE